MRSCQLTNAEVERREIGIEAKSGEELTGCLSHSAFLRCGDFGREGSPGAQVFRWGAGVGSRDGTAQVASDGASGYTVASLFKGSLLCFQGGLVEALGSSVGGVGGWANIRQSQEFWCWAYLAGVLDSPFRSSTSPLRSGRTGSKSNSGWCESVGRKEDGRHARALLARVACPSPVG